MVEPEYIVGIDLGTTHSALAVMPAAKAKGVEPGIVRIPQLVSRGSIEARELLPSFLYCALPDEGSLGLPWDEERRFAVGAFARDRAGDTPERVISSAKSWLSHTGIDRRGAVLPLHAPSDVEKISPVEASWRYLDHLAEAWGYANQKGSAPPLFEQQIVLTVPASFDAAARDLTVEAAYAAGMEDVTLLEEPQAALYAWLQSNQGRYRDLIKVSDVVLVLDIGGGTTDFSAIVAVDADGRLELHRIAVGEHILLGGDNMDLALSHRLAQKLEQAGQKLDKVRIGALAHACRAAKERLLGDPSASQMPVTLAGKGSALVGSTLAATLTRDDVEELLVEGFFPAVDSDVAPAKNRRVGLRQVGLPYASDPGITRHLAHFLRLQAGAGKNLLGDEGAWDDLLHVNHVLFNGGVLKAHALRERLLTSLNRWLTADGAPAIQALPGEDLDLAVARGAAYYGYVRKNGGLTVRGGTARAYYVGIESPAPAIPGVPPPIVSVCVAPLGLDEGQPAEVLPQELAVVVGEPVQFRFFGSTVRRNDETGTEIEEWSDDELFELAPIEVTFPSEGRNEGDFVPVRLRASVTAVGTLLLEALPLEPRVPNECFKVELSVRSGEGSEAR